MVISSTLSAIQYGESMGNSMMQWIHHTERTYLKLLLRGECLKEYRRKW